MKPKTRDCRKCKWNKECVNIDKFEKDGCLQYEGKKQWK